MQSQPSFRPTNPTSARVSSDSSSSDPAIPSAMASSATSPATSSAASSMVRVDCCDRWQVYHRLQELEIPCQCGGYQPLLVDQSTVQACLQTWSVVRRTSMSRLELAQWLNQCLHR